MINKKELPHFYVENNYGSNQNEVKNPIMRFAGCAAITACDCCLYFDMIHRAGFFKNECARCDDAAVERAAEQMFSAGRKMKNAGQRPLCPRVITQKEYQDCLKSIRRYLRPGIHGVTRLELFTEGIERFMAEQGVTDIKAKGLHGSFSEKEAEQWIIHQIDNNMPVPFLLLDHKTFPHDDYVWHWFLLNGYDRSGRIFRVKAASYGTWKWFTLREMWNTGCAKKGGLILFQNA